MSTIKFLMRIFDIWKLMEPHIQPNDRRYKVVVRGTNMKIGRTNTMEEARELIRNVLKIERELGATWGLSHYAIIDTETTGEVSIKEGDIVGHYAIKDTETDGKTDIYTNKYS